MRDTSWAPFFIANNIIIYLGMDAEMGNHSDHPLMSLCLTLILGFVDDLEDLKSIRLVCRLWKDAVMGKWRSSAVIRLAWEHYPYSFCHPCHRVINQVDYERKALDLDHFLELVRSSEEKGNSCPYQIAIYPFNRYRIGYASLSESDEAMKEFWARCGYHIKYLYLDHCSAPDTRFGTAFQQIQFRNCPKLEELLLHILPTEEKFGINSSLELDFQGGRQLLISPLLPLKLKSMKLNVCKKKECDPGPGESRIYKVTPTTKQWRALFQQVPNLKNLIVDWEISNAIEALKYRTLTGKPIKLSKLSYSVKDDQQSGAKNLSSLPPGLKEYVEAVRPPIKFVEVVPERTRWNGSFFRDLIWRKLHHPHVRRLRIAFASFCYTYGFLYFLKMLLECWHPPNSSASSSSSSGARNGFRNRWNMEDRMLRRSLYHSP